ncbi:MAG: universal stress protein [Nitrospinales bacterium]
MGKISRILLAIDGSERSFAAAVYIGKVLAKQAEIVLFHVMAEAPEAFRDVSADPLAEKENYPLSIWKSYQEENIYEFMTVASDILIASGFPKEAISVKTQAMRSGVARDILAESQQDYNILVVGRTGISKIEDITLGSIASKLIDVVAHPPLIVAGENVKSKKIVIAIDGSTGSMNAVRCVGALLDPAECEILLCHVIRPLSAQQMGAKELFLPKHEAEWIAANQRKIIPVINDAKRRLEEEGFSEKQISSEILTYQKSRAAAIVKNATKGGYDTIVLGRRGRTVVGEFQMGRVSRKILHFAYRSTLWIVG